MTLVDGQNVVKVLNQYPPTDLLMYAITAKRAGFDYIVDCSPAS
jgi:histidinol dehydrogenase